MKDIANVKIDDGMLAIIWLRDDPEFDSYGVDPAVFLCSVTLTDESDNALLLGDAKSIEDAEADLRAAAKGEHGQFRMFIESDRTGERIDLGMIGE